MRKRLNGTYTGSADSYYFFGESITSGSLWDIISGSSTDSRFTLGDSIMDSTDSNQARMVKELEVTTSCFRTLVQLSGGIITSGFSWRAGIQVSSPHIAEGYRGLINEFASIAGTILMRLSPMSYSTESDVPAISTTAPPLM